MLKTTPGHAIKNLCSGERGAKRQKHKTCKKQLVSVALLYHKQRTKMKKFYMHPKYQEFLCAIKNLQEDARLIRIR